MWLACVAHILFLFFSLGQHCSRCYNTCDPHLPGPASWACGRAVSRTGASRAGKCLAFHLMTLGDPVARRLSVHGILWARILVRRVPSSNWILECTFQKEVSWNNGACAGARSPGSCAILPSRLCPASAAPSSPDWVLGAAVRRRGAVTVAIPSPAWLLGVTHLPRSRGESLTGAEVSVPDGLPRGGRRALGKQRHVA